MRTLFALMGAMLMAACGRSPVSWADGAGGAGASHGRVSAGGGADDGDDGADGGSGPTCQQVDFLFVIDDSQSMADNQAKLVTANDAFIGGIAEAVEQLESVHVGVITTDAYAPNASECRALGGLVVQTGGADSSGAQCGPYAEGHAFMTEVDDIETSFPCAARVGTDGSGSEAVMGAILAAVSPPLTDPGACNEGFVRDGALLVMVIVTDEDLDIAPEFAYSQLLAYKNPSDLVVVALANPSDGECGPNPAFGIESLVAQAQHGFLGSICADDYGDIFDDAVAVVAEACPDR
jgi:hypothetical protein